jgi:hypothetical protein
LAIIVDHQKVASIAGLRRTIIQDSYLELVSKFGEKLKSISQTRGFINTSAISVRQIQQLSKIFFRKSYFANYSVAK